MASLVDDSPTTAYKVKFRVALRGIGVLRLQIRGPKESEPPYAVTGAWPRRLRGVVGTGATHASWMAG
eukprot:3466876-Pyramimonas_sp.AAC.2